MSRLSVCPYSDLALISGLPVNELAKAQPPLAPLRLMSAPLSADCGRGASTASLKENIDTGGPLGRAIVVIVGAIAELERSLIVERVRAGMRRARLEGTHIGRNPLILDHEAIWRERCQGRSMRQIAKCNRISTATVQRSLRKPAESIRAQDLKKSAQTAPARPVTEGLRKPTY